MGPRTIAAPGGERAHQAGAKPFGQIGFDIASQCREALLLLARQGCQLVLVLALELRGRQAFRLGARRVLEVALDVRPGIE